MTAPVVHLIVGPAQHGVVRFGVDLDVLLGAATVLQRVSGPVLPGRGVHLQFTDRLFGADAAQAVAAVSGLAADVHRGGGHVTATLHDLPQPSDGANYSTRARSYAALAAVLDGIVVSSEHERKLLSSIGVHGEVAVIPLPIAAPLPGPGGSAHPLSVAVFGFIYPGKGHAEVLEAMSELPSDIRLVAIGEPSAGHDYLVDDLHRTARTQGRPFVVTGHVPDDALAAQLHAVTVPVVAHRHVSASASLNSWISAGRRPLVPATPYFCEVADRNPGALWVCDDDRRGLSAAISGALDQPATTWLPPDLICSPTPDQAAESYRRLLRSVHQ